jgi:hypothetical protein
MDQPVTSSVRRLTARAANTMLRWASIESRLWWYTGRPAGRAWPSGTTSRGPVRAQARVPGWRGRVRAGPRSPRTGRVRAEVITAREPSRTVASASCAASSSPQLRKRQASRNRLRADVLCRSSARRCSQTLAAYGTDRSSRRTNVCCRAASFSGARRGRTCSWPRSGRSGRYAASHLQGSGRVLKWQHVAILARAVGR